MPEAVKFKRCGVKAVVPDLCIPLPVEPYHGLYIELKRVSGSETSDVQLDWVKLSLIKVFGEDVLTDDELDGANENGIRYVLELHKMHGNRKKALGHRVQVLRVLIRRLHDDKRLKMTEFEFNLRCEKYLDNILSKYEYRIETAIERIRNLCST